MFSKKEAGESSVRLLDTIRAKFQQYKLESPDPKLDVYKSRPSGSGLYNFTRIEFFKKIYLETKSFFETHQDSLLPDEKSIILNEYIQLWREIEGYLDIEDTEFAEHYKGIRFGMLGSDFYDGRAPMLAGFNLKNIVFDELDQKHLMFLSVDFSGADFGNTKLPYASFHDCNFIQHGVKPRSSGRG